MLVRIKKNAPAVHCYIQIQSCISILDSFSSSISYVFLHRVSKNFSYGRISKEKNQPKNWCGKKSGIGVVRTFLKNGITLKGGNRYHFPTVG